ncbi:hypothetical protein CMUS01_14903 [Colletotrichum musicola]|uniref:Uncharacterized protein n=1 Tax=Colletotrichum musicola TaxID=2175873 RepID=A0A8H6J128_9PEZI|nr:hypothetical protein CMUS01_14903 [Colletotrichum musicola]
MRDMRAASLVGDPGRLAGPMAATRGSIGASRLTGVAQGLGADVFAVTLRREARTRAELPSFLLLLTFSPFSDIASWPPKLAAASTPSCHWRRRDASSDDNARRTGVRGDVQIGPGGVGSTAGGISPVVCSLSIFLYICLSWYGCCSRNGRTAVWSAVRPRSQRELQLEVPRPLMHFMCVLDDEHPILSGLLAVVSNGPPSKAQSIRTGHGTLALWHAGVHKKGHQRNHELVFPSRRIPQATVDKENPSRGLPLDSTEWRLWDGQQAAEAAAQGPGGLHRPRRAGDDQDEREPLPRTLLEVLLAGRTAKESWVESGNCVAPSACAHQETMRECLGRDSGLG